MKIKSWIAACGLAVSLLAQPAAAGQFEDATAAYGRGDYATALKLMRPLADQGNAHAQYNLGRMYANGWGVPQDYAEAVKWYRLAAEQGDAPAQNSLGGMYDIGRGVPRDYAQALKWFRKAADQGYASAQTGLGVMYWDGLGAKSHSIANPPENCISYRL